MAKYWQFQMIQSLYIVCQVVALKGTVDFSPESAVLSFMSVVRLM